MSDETQHSFTLTFRGGYGEKIPLSAFASLFVGTQWTWAGNVRCKHLVIFMDTRDRSVRAYDRANNALTLAELARQHSSAEGMAEPYGDDKCVLADENARLRETVKRLNRRCQQAEAAIAEAEHVLRIAPDEKGVRWVRGSLGRALLGERCRRLEEEIQALKIERGMLITMLRRARAWGISGLGYCSSVALDIAAWVDGGMKFPPPALPDHIKEIEGTEETRNGK